MPFPGEPQRGPCEPIAARVKVTPPGERARLVLRWTRDPVCGHGGIDLPALRAGSRGF